VLPLLTLSLLGESAISIHSVVEAMSKLNILGNAISRLSRSIDNIIMVARLKNDRYHNPSEIHISGDNISVAGLVKDFGVQEVLLDLNRITEYLSTRLPPSIAVPMSDQLMPSVILKLKTYWLDRSLPSSLDALQEFQETVMMVQNFAQSLDELGWSGGQELHDWADKVPYTWLQKKKESTLSDIRKLCLRGIQEKKVVERVETQMVSKDDAILQGQAQEEEDDGWGAEWGQEESEAAEPQPELQPEPNPEPAKEEEDDADAWGWNEDEAPDEPPDDKAANGKDGAAEDAEDDSEAWGWGEDEEKAPSAEPSASTPKKATKASNTNGEHAKLPAQREITLKETYTISDIPDSLLGMIGHVISDMEKLTQATYVELDAGIRHSILTFSL
jgi:protein transport protein DSL1/ZW10